ncbi:hypothetical protein Tco_0417200 [Tanacetum coccineum]
MCTTHEQKRVEARQALDRFEAHNKALEARIVVLETRAYHHELQHHDADDRAIRHITRIQALEAGARVDTLEDIASRLYGSFVHHLDILYGMLSIMGHSQLALP